MALLLDQGAKPLVIPNSRHGLVYGQAFVTSTDWLGEVLALRIKLSAALVYG